MDVDFQKAVLQILARSYQACKRGPGLSTVRMIYEGTNVGSPARRLMVDTCAWDMKPNAVRLESMSTEKDAGFMKDLVKALVTVRDRPSKRIARP
jgi:hypothetical protein